MGSELTSLPISIRKAIDKLRGQYSLRALSEALLDDQPKGMG